MLDTDSIAATSALAGDRDGGAPSPQNTRSSSPFLREDVIDALNKAAHPDAVRMEPWIAGFSRAMGPVGLISCLFIAGWWAKHIII